MVALGIGVALSIPGLVSIGAFWIAMGFAIRSQGLSIKDLQARAKDDAGKKAVVLDRRTFTISTALFIVLGVPSLLTGILELGISADDANWRWLPIVVGAYALFIGVGGAVLYLTGSAIEAKTGPAPTIPATIWIKAVKETGTYINERPRLEFVFRVEPEASSGVAAYEVTKKATVPFTAMGSLKVGDGFSAKVAGPEHPTSMDIAWDQPVGTAGADDVSARLAALDALKADGKVSDEEYRSQRERILGSL
ncbi:SHOCT domain-containing protein [Nocardioides marmorisolisilvae]|uniref:SHOCT domain-containing protein n=1 Tax=Nocardioides marmorisolisilvae TaxID=1542737 RepID=A0A3N0E012_9ACTN|nr:SHOCT domain-containing protein [Nocardioides marmorisolisilvae]